MYVVYEWSFTREHFIPTCANHAVSTTYLKPVQFIWPLATVLIWTFLVFKKLILLKKKKCLLLNLWFILVSIVHVVGNINTLDLPPPPELFSQNSHRRPRWTRRIILWCHLLQNVLASRVSQYLATLLHAMYYFQKIKITSALIYYLLTKNLNFVHRTIYFTFYTFN